MHLSRFAEEIVIWMSAPFGFVTPAGPLDHRLLHHAAEAQPGRRRAGARQDRPDHRRAASPLLTVMKGLPLAYSKDMQEDKEQLFDAADTLEIVPRGDDRHGRATSSPCPSAWRAVAGAGFSTATDLADWLVRGLGLPFRDAHHVTGRLVAEAEQRGCGLEELPLDAMQAVEPRITAAVYDVLGVENSVRSPHELRRHRARSGSPSRSPGGASAWV